MKKTLSLVLAAALLLSFASPASAASNSLIDSLCTNLQGVVDVLNRAIAMLQRLDDAERTAIEKATDGAEADEITAGLASNPAEIGELATCSFYNEKSGLDCYLGLRLLDVLRGEEAAEIVENLKKFSVSASAGKELVILRFEVSNIKDYGGKDVPAAVWYGDFKGANSTRAVSQKKMTYLPGLENALDVSLYSGSIAEGYVVIELDVGAEGYAVFGDFLWFHVPTEAEGD